MKRLLCIAAAALSVTTFAACGKDNDPITTDTEGFSVAEAQQLLVSEGVPSSNVSVRGDRDNPQAIVCDHTPDSVSIYEPTTLYVAQDCDSAMEEGGVLFGFVKSKKLKKHKVKKVKPGTATKLIQKAKKQAEQKKQEAQKKAEQKRQEAQKKAAERKAGSGSGSGSGNRTSSGSSSGSGNRTSSGSGRRR